MSHSSEDGHPQKSVPYEVRLGTKIVMGISAPEGFLAFSVLTMPISGSGTSTRNLAGTESPRDFCNEGFYRRLEKAQITGVVL